jgi:hypothetical protein
MNGVSADAGGAAAVRSAQQRKNAVPRLNITTQSFVESCPQYTGKPPFCKEIISPKEKIGRQDTMENDRIPPL